MNQPEIIIIAALAEANRVIANHGNLPWNIPEDSQRFQLLTQNYTVIVGRNTWDKDLKTQPLEGSNIIVISSKPEEVKTELQSINYPVEVLVFDSLQEALEKAREPEKIFVAGGASIYSQALEIADTLELTLVEGDFEGDTLFPKYQHLVGSKFELVARQERPGFRYETYKIINNC